MIFNTFKASDWAYEGEKTNINTLKELIDFIESTKEQQAIIRFFNGKWELIDYDDYIE